CARGGNSLFDYW
nr:immunoglobulin heavy chain junction region [Macaca mulatta]MOW86572.1 immunoglobulin heavy chain junction region [Macaca mulatta]MOW86638.1 immunoglobulin heavy chain junction region [Macaca mulatta]MOW86656.1 immunoglobulin heavy chain junction region [Macaca mulatta]MOW86770.1 immunoglobulin heavy chain junction region [Macaca mulatta]